MDRGELVPDDVTIAVLLERLNRLDASGGALLDGFPRTRAQAEALDVALAQRAARVDRAIHLDVPTTALVDRLSSRWVCEAQGHIYNQQANPPRAPGVCDVDGSRLVQRADDRPETVRARLALTLAGLDEVVDHYRGQGVLQPVDAGAAIADVSRAVLAALDAPVGPARGS
jgi:adenylate kinase